MGQDKLDEILEARKRAAAPAEPTPMAEVEGDQFFSKLLGDGMSEFFLELQCNDGTRTAFPYESVVWMNYSPVTNSIEIDFGVAIVSLKGRALYPKLFHGLRQRRVAWVKEADSEMQDHKGNEIFIESIDITPLVESTGEEEPAAETK